MSLLLHSRPLIPWRWIGVPALLSVIATVVLAIPVEVLGLRLPEPVFPLVLSFAWAAIRPSVLTPFAVLGLGLFLDLFWGGPPGLWAVSLLVSHASILAGRGIMTGMGRSMGPLWYLASTILAFGAAYLITQLDGLSQPDLLSVFWQFLATCLLYPFARVLTERYEDADVRFR